MDKTSRFDTVRKKAGLFYNRRNSKKTACRRAIFATIAIMIALGVMSSNHLIPTALAANTLTINGYALDGRQMNMWIVIQQNGATVKTGFTPLTFAGTTGSIYSVQAHDYSAGNITFDHWEDGSTTRTRAVALNSDMSITSYYTAPPPPNRPPVAANDSATVNQDSSINLTVLANDSDSDGDSLTITSTTAPLHGLAAVNTNGTVTYTPVARFSGQDSFSYTISDGKGGSASATVNIQVNFVNYAPIATDQTFSTSEDIPRSIMLGATDANGDPLTYSVVSQPLHGSLLPVSGNGNFTYTPSPDFNGQDSFTFKANDGKADSNIATISMTVIPVNDAPMASDQLVNGSEDMAIPLTLGAADVDGDSLTYYLVSMPSHGILTGIAPNLTYTPNPNFNGQDSFAFKANDGTLNSNTATVAISVLPVNDNPVATNDSAVTNQGISVTINALANDTDIDGDLLKIISTTTPAHGNPTIAMDGSSITYNPASGFYGADSFSYTISDGKGGTSTASIAINVKFVPSTYTLSVNSVDMYGKTTGGLYTVISKSGSTVKTGFTPLSFVGSAGATYSVTVSDYGSTLFDHWSYGSSVRTGTVTLNANTTVTAVFRVPTVSLSPTSGIGGTTVSATGSYFNPNSQVALTYDGTNMGTITTNSLGGFVASFKAPSLGTGFHTVIATDAKTWKASAKFQDTTPPPPHPLAYMFPKTGVYVALYMYPSGDGATQWQKVYDQKVAHPSVPIVATFNPNSGPGPTKDANVANWVAKLKSAGVVMTGYTYDSYGARSLTDLKADADKYKNWYNADGLFIDEFTNKVGYETHYSSLTSYIKSIGMKMTMGNPGTDVPKSYVGVVDVLNITEGAGYMPISWLQYCVQCSADQGWHTQYDKRYFAYMRYDITSLDTTFETNSANWVGLLYITDGNDSNGRWFALPSYFGTLVATLDR